MATLLVLGGCATTGGTARSSATGESSAKACFTAASQRTPGRVGLHQCTAALADAALPVDLRAATYVNRGIVNMDAGRLDAAVADFDAAIALAPGNADAYINKAVALLQMADREADAIVLLDLALEYAPQRPEIVYFHRGVANEGLGRLRAAFDDYSQAAQLAPGWPEPANQLQRFKFVRRKTLAG